MLRNQTVDNIKVRLYSFQRFLNTLLSSKELIYCPELVSFLSANDEEFITAKAVRKKIKHKIVKNSYPYQFTSLAKNRSG